jgi:hypothetical protein
MLGSARLAEQGGETDKAKDLYGRFLTKYPESERRALITARLTALGGTPPTEVGAGNPEEAADGDAAAEEAE